MASPNDGLRLAPSWITPAAGKPDREVRDVITVERRRVVTGSYDTDAQTYITAVETADGQALETAVKDAINAFVVGCKADDIWSAIKASCILAGARTLAGALVPLVGTAPTNFNFVSEDYNRKTGLLGNGTNKYLNSNRAGNADPQDSAHGAVYRNNTTNPGIAVYLGSQGRPGDGPFRNVVFYSLSDNVYFGIRKLDVNDPFVASVATASGLVGVARPSSASMNYRINGNTVTSSITSATPGTPSVFVFANNSNGAFANPAAIRLAFYSIGESLNLAQLDARITTLITTFGTAIL